MTKIIERFLHSRSLIAYFLLFLFGFTSCADSRKEQEQQADERLKHAQQLIASNSLNAARIELDSIHILFPRLVNKRKVAQIMQDTIVKRENLRSLVYCDSILPIKQREADSIQKNFRFEKNAKYQDFGNYIYKTQSVEANLNRCYLKAYVDENADFFFVSNYTGAKIDHSSLRISVGDSFVQTDTLNSADCHSFTDGGIRFESLSLKNEADNGAAAFIADHSKSIIKVKLNGKRKYTYNLADQDKKAIVEAYRLWIVKKDIARLQKEIKIASLRVNRLTNK